MVFLKLSSHQIPFTFSNVMISYISNQRLLSIYVKGIKFKRLIIFWILAAIFTFVWSNCIVQWLYNWHNLVTTHSQFDIITSVVLFWLIISQLSGKNHLTSNRCDEDKGQCIYWNFPTIFRCHFHGSYSCFTYINIGKWHILICKWHHVSNV